jgi:predicted dithiol-disulfide oxidoreductase (DUF899 family)
MSLPEVTTREDWLAARREFLVREKELMRQRDALNADRRRLPMVRVDKPYTFEGPNGPLALADLFDGRRQLVVQHVMFGPDWDAPCPGCTAGIVEIAPGMLTHLASRETTFVLVSRAPYGKIATAAAERGWFIPWYSSYGSDFNYDFAVTLDSERGQLEYNYRPEPGLLGDDTTTEMPGYSSFLRDGDEVYHTYSTYARGVAAATGTYTMLDLTALGRQEDWEEPKGRVDPVRGGDPTFTS